MESQNFNELDEMKQQLQMLQDKFQKEVTINDRLIQESIRHKMSWNKKLFWSDIISIPILIFIQLVMTEVFQLSWWSLGIFTAVVLAIVFADYKINVSTLRDEDLQRNNLIETAKKLVRMKRLGKIECIITFPLGFSWAGWVCVKLWLQVNLQRNELLSQGYGLFCVVLFVLGLLIALYFYRKMQRSNDELINQINNLTAIKDSSLQEKFGEIQLMKCDNTIFADEIVSKLNENGIEARVHDETQDTAVGAYGPIVGIAIFVSEQQYEQALALVKPIVEARDKAIEERLAENSGLTNDRKEKHKAIIIVIVLFLIMLGTLLFVMSHEL
jgi:Ca2+/Na+ antiporter